MEDSPIVIEPEVESEDKLKFFEQMEYIRNNSKVVYELDNENLQEYVSSFITERELFTFDVNKDIILTNYSKKLKFPSEIGTIAYKFNKHSEKSKHPIVMFISFILYNCYID